MTTTPSPQATHSEKEGAGKSFEVKFHYGWENTNGKTPYEYVRETHEFLTDDNHDYKDEGDRIVIYRNEKSPPQHPITPWWARAGAGDYWFSNLYRSIPPSTL